MLRATLRCLLYVTPPLLLVSALIAAIALDDSARDWLYVVGGCTECLGVFLVAAAEMSRPLAVLRRGLGGAYRTVAAGVEARLRSIFHRPSDHHAHVSGGVIHAGATVSARLVKGVSPAATDTEKIAWLLRRDEETQNKLADLEEHDQTLERELRQEIEQARAYAQQAARERLRERDETQLEWRYAGLVLLFVGLALSTSGNLV